MSLNPKVTSLGDRGESAIPDTPVVNIDRQRVSDLEGPVKDLWERIRRGFGISDLDGALVEDRTQWYATRQDYVERMVDRSSRYLYHIVDSIERRGMPTELALLPFIESAFNPQATSVAKAAGMWQFMPATGKYFNLKQNMFRDERRDVLASTEAALDYLQKLYGMFGDWHLALAAYNWGEGSVQKAIARNQRLGLPTDYASLNMPNETRYYLPKLQAVKNIVARPEAYSLTLPVVENHPYFVSLTTNRDMDVELVARLAGLSVPEFQALNPSFKRPVILGATNPQILLPFRNAEKFQDNLAAYRKPLASWTAVTVGGRERVETLASRLGVGADTVRSVNNIPKGMRLRAGSTVLVPRTGAAGADISEHVAQNATIAIEPDLPDTKRISIKTRRGDTVSRIAARYRVTAAQIKGWNRLSADALPPGRPLVLVVPYGSKLTSTPETGGGKGRTSRRSVAKSAHSTDVKQSSRSSAAASVHRKASEKAAGKPVAKSVHKKSR